MAWQPDDIQDAEMVVLGHLLTAKHALAAIADIDLQYSDFSFPIFGIMYKLMSMQLVDSPRVDPIKLLQDIGKDDSSLPGGGKAFLKTLRTYSMGNLKSQQAARAVKDASRRRAIVSGCQSAIESAQNYAVTLDEAQQALHDTLRSVADIKSKSPERVGDLVPGYLESLIQLQKSGGVVGIGTQFADLDRLTGGFCPGEVVILAGRPGTGKTALALNIAYSAARRGVCCGVFSLEMPAQQLLSRIYASSARVDAQRFRNGRFSQDDWQRIHTASDEISRMPLLFSDRSAIKPTQIREKARIWQQDHGLRMMVIDYLQLISPESRGQSREREVADISRAVKTTAVDLGIPILLLAQLNREAEQAARPKLSHLRESGAVEQDADIVLFLRPWKVDTGEEYPVVELDIAKGRSNACGTVKLTYAKRHLLFGSHQEGA